MYIVQEARHLQKDYILPCIPDAEHGKLFRVSYKNCLDFDLLSHLKHKDPRLCDKIL